MYTLTCNVILFQMYTLAYNVIFSKCVDLVPNLTHFESFFKVRKFFKLRCHTPGFILHHLMNGKVYLH